MPLPCCAPRRSIAQLALARKCAALVLRLTSNHTQTELARSTLAMPSVTSHSQYLSRAISPLTPPPLPQSPAAPPQPQHATSLAERVRPDFAVLDQTVHDKPLVYLDSAATSQKPAQVLDAVRAYYDRDNSNVHRGVHALAARATDAYEAARRKVARLINAPSDREVVWARGATEAVNLVANSWGRQNLGPGDEVRAVQEQPSSFFSLGAVLEAALSMRCCAAYASCALCSTH